ncbi:DNA sulfur modification protein DndB [Nocardia brevicatena]|uniref:DNA sulfur modification protein DndB n=1 Tax=Nocardia brevicatena TaxID=37327 RepID=UPI001FDF95EB|nr:DNA sulfur modification protein DndB [Nocardia brevicatena]
MSASPSEVSTRGGVSARYKRMADIRRIHQDFADAAQAEAIPSSLLAVYNTREPINGVLADIIDLTRFFHGRIDSTSSALPKASQAVFPLNQVRQFVKELLFADYALSESSVGKQSGRLIGEKSARDEFVADAVALVEMLSDHTDPWRETRVGPVGFLDARSSG